MLAQAIYCLCLIGCASVTDSKIDAERKKIEYFKKTKSYLCKYAYALDQNNDLPQISDKYPNKIWQIWLQGVNNAPPIVQSCLRSVQKFSGGREIIVLDEAKVKQYVTIPEYIWEKYKKGIIKRAHFADIVRIYLLYCYGGTWIDATVILEDKIPQYILDSDLFLFQISKLQERHNYQICANWFMHAKPGNHFIKAMILLLNEYWRQENSLKNYFIFYYFASIAVENDKECRKIFDEMPYYPETTHVWDCLHKRFNTKEYERIRKSYPLQIYKVTYRVDKKTSDNSGSFFNYFRSKF